MINTLLAAALLLFAFVAPAAATAQMAAVLLSTMCVVMITTRLLTGSSPSLSASFKAVWLSIFFMIIALFSFSSFVSSTGITQFGAIPGLGVMLMFFCSYVAGFSVALETKFITSAIIATAATLTSQLITTALAG